MPKVVGLTAKQERFVAEYLIDSNATRSALAAGYSEHTAARLGSQLLATPKVKAALTAGRRRLAAKLELTAERVLADIERISAKAERAKKYGEALKGKELLGKHLKLFTEKHEHGGIGGGPIHMSVTSQDEAL
jgi:phage terminase small subunit